MNMPKTSSSVSPNLLDYEKTYASFSWEQVRYALDGLPENKGLNIAHEAVDRHVHTNQIAFRWLGKEGKVKDFTYKALSKETNRFANVLQGLGIGKGERIFLLTGRIPELYIAALGTWKNTSVFCPLFSAFAPDP